MTGEFSITLPAGSGSEVKTPRPLCGESAIYIQGKIIISANKQGKH
jgi:hypothetical protein